MFKRLRERIAEEATKFPVGQLNNNPGRPLETESKPAANSTEDLITLSDSSSVVVPLTSPQQFSIGDEDGSLSEQSTPQKRQADTSTSSELYYTPNSISKEQRPSNASDVNVFHEYHPSMAPPYIPQSDIESEREDPPTLNLDGISKDQLLGMIQALKARSYKYKNKYSEVVKSYKDLLEEKVKIENTLTETQDKGLRRVAELREQCQLEQKAKAHLEENLRLMLEEKDSRISVLETQINLLKDGGDNATENCDKKPSEDGSGDETSMDKSSPITRDIVSLQEKNERLEHVLSQVKNTMVTQKDQISLLRKQNESLSRELEEKVKELNEIQDKETELKSEHEAILRNMQVRLEELEKQQEESIMSMAETKRNMHEELELKEKQLNKAEDEARQYQSAAEHEKAVITEFRKQHEEKINELQNQLTATEKTLEDEKKNLIQELTRGKTAAINLMQQECTKNVTSIEEEWKTKFQELQFKYENSDPVEVGDTSNKLEIEKELKIAQLRLEELNSAIAELKAVNSSLKDTIKKLESETLETQKAENLKCVEDKFQLAEKNYKTQLEELKQRIKQLEKEKAILESEQTEKIKSIQGKFETKLKDNENKSLLELKSKEELLKTMCDKYENCSKEISVYQESMKDKENMILKLKANLSSVSKEHSEKVEELNRRVRQLEHEREQLMLQAQERVSATEAKCREDLKQLQETNNQLVQENKEIEKLKIQVSVLNNQLDESLLVAEGNQTASSQEISLMKVQLSEAGEKLTETLTAHSQKETELIDKIKNLEGENNKLHQDSNHVQKLKAEKEQLNEKLKSAEAQLKKVSHLEIEIQERRKEIACFQAELESLQGLKFEKEQLMSKISLLENSESVLKNNIEILKTQTTTECASSEELMSLKAENEALLKKIGIIEKFDPSDPNNAAIQQYMAVVKKEYETALKAKEVETESKLKHLVKDFCIQMDVKDKDCDQMVSELQEKIQDLEERLQKEHQVELAALRQDLFEKDCALEEMHDHYEELIQEKNIKLKEYELAAKNLSQSNGTVAADTVHPGAEGSDWDETWAVPDETCENTSPVHNSKECEAHLQQIVSMQEELVKCNSEIKELRILLRLSPPQSLVNNNNHGSTSQPIPEPTEFEYLKNIIYEYMMGKEPVTLAKVIAAVLRFSDVQTQQVIRKEESRHPTK